LDIYVSQVQKENTATWVDERYGSLLARLSRDTLDESANDLVKSIKGMGRMANRIEVIRRYAGCLTEEPIKKVGYGVSKPGTRVWMMGSDMDKKTLGLSISSADFNRHGKLIRPTSKGLVLVTHHAMMRLFERLRTNALGEVITIGLVPLTKLHPAEVIGAEQTIRISGVGRFEAVAGMDETSPNDLVWIIKTFIDD
jgi:hypothetical protein